MRVRLLSGNEIIGLQMVGQLLMRKHKICLFEPSADANKKAII